MNECNFLKEKDEKSIDDVLEEIVGPAGWAQWIVLIAMGPVIVCGTLPVALLLSIFTPKHRCFVPGCDTLNASPEYLDFSIIDVSIPKNHDSMTNQEELFGSCRMYQR